MRRALTAIVMISIVVAILAAANMRRAPGDLGLDWQLVKETPHEVIAEPRGDTVD